LSIPSAPFEVLAFSAKLVGMIPITKVLIAEHRMFCCLFEHIQKALPKVENLPEIKHLARMVEGLLRNHAKGEEDVFLRVDACAAQRIGSKGNVRHEHQEIDAKLKLVHMAKDLARSRNLFKAALVATRKHFNHEERFFFPLVEQCMEPRTLEKLGKVWLLRYHSPAHWTI
jgi:hypothetical protein